MANYHFYKFCLEDEIIDEENLVFIPGYKRNEEGSIIPKGVKDIKEPYLGRPMFSVVVDRSFIKECLDKYSTELLDFLNFQYESFQYEKERFLDHTELIVKNYIADKLTHFPVFTPFDDQLIEGRWRVESEKTKIQLQHVLDWVAKKRGESTISNHKKNAGYSMKITWDDKTDLCELVYVLYKSNKIKKDGNPISQKELAELFSSIFNNDIRGQVNDLVGKRLRETERGERPMATFIGQLYSMIRDKAMEIGKAKERKERNNEG